MDEPQETFASLSASVRTDHDVPGPPTRPSKARSGRTSVRAVSIAKATSVQIFFSCMGSPSASARSTGHLSPAGAVRGCSSTNTPQRCEVPLDLAAFTLHRASSSPASEPRGSPAAHHRGV